tara:strand:+ start:11799 stop:13004 length:1206 start_codon:yes stop_codon:yes gene_type:complete
MRSKMKKPIYTAAIILAAGSGSRYDKKCLKQYEYIDKNTVIYHSIKPFVDAKIDLIYVVINNSHNIYAKNALKGLKITKFINGGKTRQESVSNALIELKKYMPKKILIHDAVRPNISVKIINKIIKYLNVYESVIPVIKINDALKRINFLNFITEDINKKELVLTQTPQGFLFKKILIYHAKTKIINANDDVSIINKKNNNIFTFTGDYQNIKITTKKDLRTIKAIMNKKVEYIPITGLGIDIHRFDTKKNKNNKIKLGTTNIKYEKSLIGHSDADVIIHALVDSILGTIAKGDIGNKFPNTDKKWKNANSKLFLEYALNELKNCQCKIIHTDITIICEEPKIDPYRELIKKNVAKLLNLSKKSVSIKATTSEKMGYLGRQEGIMVQCITTVLRPFDNEKF